MEIGKNTKVTVSLGVLAALVVSVWRISVAADHYRDLIMANATSVAVLTKALRLAGLDDEIGDLKRERRVISAKIQTTESGALLNEYQRQVQEIADAISEREQVRQCVVDDKEPCE